jgi:hypothetical protein
LLGLSGGVAVLSAVAAIWIPSLAGLAVIAAVVGYLIHHRRRARSLRTSLRPTELGMPTVVDSAKRHDSDHVDNQS